MSTCLICGEQFQPACGICEDCGGQALVEKRVVELMRELYEELQGCDLPKSAGGILAEIHQFTHEDRWSKEDM